LSYQEKESVKKKSPLLSISLKTALTALLAGLVLFLLWPQESIRDAAGAPPPEESRVSSGPAGAAAVEILYPAPGKLTRSLRFPGYLEPDTSVTVRPQASGVILNLPVAMGDRLEEGALLALIDPSALTLNYRIADAGFELARSSLAKLQRIYEANGLSLREYEEAVSQFEISRSRRDLALLQLGFAEVTAPLSGTILKIHSSQGSLASPEAPLLTMADLSYLKIEAAVPEEYYEKFHEEASEWQVRIIRDSEPPVIREARLHRLSPLIDPESRSFQVVCRVDNRDQKLKPGMAVKTEFIVHQAQGLTLPVSALRRGNRLFYLEQGSPDVRSLTLAEPFFDGELLEVPGYLAENPFIVFGPETLEPGDTVFPVPPVAEGP